MGAAAGLTACLIVRDEAERLPACLQSLQTCSAVTDVCVLDTGSMDATVRIARAHDARVEEWPWRDDFAAARNRATAMARTPWVLIIDADERLRADGAALQEILSRAGGLDLLAIEVDDVRAGRLVTTVPSIRLFRPERVEYVGRLHETPRARPGRSGRGSRVDRSVLSLEHIGYDSAEALERRRIRNLALADRDVEAVRARGVASEELVAALVNRGRAAATGSGGLCAGLGDWLEAWSMPLDTPFRLWAGELAVMGLVESKRAAEAAPVLRELGRAGTDEANLAWLGATALISLGRFAEALPLLRRAEGRCTAMGERPSDDSVLGERLKAEVDTGDALAAAETAARLIVEHHEWGQVLTLFLALTEGFAVAAAHLLRDAAATARSAVNDGLIGALDEHGEHGSQVATHLRAAGSPASLPVAQRHPDRREKARSKTSRTTAGSR